MELDLVGGRKASLCIAVGVHHITPEGSPRGLVRVFCFFGFYGRFWISEIPHLLFICRSHTHDDEGWKERSRGCDDQQRRLGGGKCAWTERDRIATKHSYEMP